jgi:DNA (cytosine-5)-methyltransferase 1
MLWIVYRGFPAIVFLLEETAMGRKSTTKYSFIDLFAGAGGMTQGFVEAGGRPVFAVECDKAAARTYRGNFGPHIFAGDIANVSTFPQADVIIGGPPCQGFSQLGSRNPDDPRNYLWEQYLRAVSSVMPAAFVMENVPQLLRSGHFESFRQAVEDLGYQVQTGVLDASLFGVPQKRKRAFAIGCRLGSVSLPTPRGRSVTVREAIGYLPLEPDGVNWHVGRNPTPLSVERYRHVPPGGNHYSLPHELKPACWKNKRTGMTDVFGRLRWDSQSLTIRTEFFKPEKGCYLHPEANRPITHREAADLQTFPKDFKFAGSRIEVARQIGNAVPARLARAVADHVFGALQESGHSPVKTKPIRVPDDADQLAG